MSKLKVEFIDNSATQYEGFADRIVYANKTMKAKLYLGDRHSCAMVQLQYRKIAAVVNCDTDLFGLAKEKDIRYLKVDPCIDDDDKSKNVQHALKVFEIAYNFIDQELSAGKNVLVHCEKGITKSVAIITYYLMKKMDLSLASAYKEVRKYRTAALPQPSLFNHLIAAEIKLRGVETVRMQGKQVIYIDSSSFQADKSNNHAGSDKSSERYFVGGVLVSIVAAIFIGIYIAAGKV